MRVSRFYRRFLLMAGIIIVAITLTLSGLHALRGPDLSSIDAALFDPRS